MALSVESEADARVQFLPLVEGHRLEEFERGAGIGRSEQRQRGFVLGVALLVGVAGLLLLNVSSVRQQDTKQIPGRRGAVHRSVESLANQPGQPAGVVDVRPAEGEF